MTFLRLGLRARLALALVGVAVLAVGLATLLSNQGLGPRLDQAARSRLERSAHRLALLAAADWSAAGRAQLEHVAMMSGVDVRLVDSRGRTLDSGMGSMMGSRGGPTASAPVVVNGRLVGRVVVSPAGGQLLSPEETHLHHSLDRLHLAAGAASVAAALLLAFLLAEGLSRPLRRIRLAAQRMQEGDLATRVEVGGGPEVQAVGHALNRLAETLQHEEDVRRETVADLAHELRTPVNGLLGRIEAAQDGVLDDGAANLEAMHAEALRLTRLLEDLAKLAEAERPGLLVEKRPVDLAEVVAQEVEDWRAGFEGKGIELRSSLEPTWVRGDRDRLGQIAANLLSNALRYTETGGSVLAHVAPVGSEALLEVADTGVGIAADDLPHVFKRFWRGERSRSRATGGAGIGLAIVRELVLAHEGRIDVESASGKGSRFRVFLPALLPAPTQQSRPRARNLQIGAAS